MNGFSRERSFWCKKGYNSYTTVDFLLHELLRGVEVGFVGAAQFRVALLPVLALALDGAVASLPARAALCVPRPAHGALPPAHIAHPALALLEDLFRRVIASIANGAIAVVMLLLTILQGELMPKPTVGNLCIVISVVIFPVVAAFQLRSVKRREAALAALGPKANGPRTALQRQPSTTIGFTETFSVA